MRVKSFVLVLLISLIGHVNAQDNLETNDENFIPPYLKEYKKSLAESVPEIEAKRYKMNGKKLQGDDIPDADALKHMRRARRLSELATEIENEFPLRFSGGDVDDAQIGEPVLHIWIKGLNEKEKKNIEERFSGVIFESSLYNKKEISAMNSRIANKIWDSGIRGLVGVGYDTIQQKFIIFTEPQAIESIRNIIQGDGEFSKILFYFKVSSPMSATASPDLWAGMPLRNTTQAGLSYRGITCTAGFNVVGGIFPFTIIAGHCGQAGDKMDTQKFGWFGGDFYGAISNTVFMSGDRTDYGIIGNDNFKHSTPGKYVYIISPTYSGSPVYWRSEIRREGLIVGSKNPSVHEQYCAAGAVSGWKCGKTTTINATYFYNGRQIRNLSSLSVCSKPGDSGGPVVTGNTERGGNLAVGIVVASTDICAFTGSFGSVPAPITAFVPINFILEEYKVELASIY